MFGKCQALYKVTILYTPNFFMKGTPRAKMILGPAKQSLQLRAFKAAYCFSW